jgi:hypothetical protein
MTFLFNNCRNRDHARYGAGAFFDLALSGRQATMAKGLRPGDTCIVASYAESGFVAFHWYAFAHEKRMLDEKGELVRVLFGRARKMDLVAKAQAAKTRSYENFFDRHGHFKIGSVFRIDEAAQAARVGSGAWAFTLHEGRR